MGTHRNQKIDWAIAGLDGGLFPQARSGSDPLLTIPLEAEPEVPGAASLTPVELFPPEVRLFLSEPQRARGSEPDELILAPARAISAPQRAISAPVSSRRARLVAAAVTSGILLGSLCAMAFSKGFTEPSRVRAEPTQAGAPAEGQPNVRAPGLEVLPVEMPTSIEVPASVEERGDALVMAGPAMATTAVPAALSKPLVPAMAAARPAPAATFLGGAKPLGNALSAFTARPADLDRSAAAVALAVAGRRAASCTPPDDARVSMPVSVTFAASGHVTSARVDGGPFAGTEVGGCIARQLRSATVSAFDGAPVTIHSSIRLH